MNKDIPEGGRHVKCARCGNQWRLVPEGHVEETIEPDEAEHNPVDARQQSSAEHRHEQTTAHETHPHFAASQPADDPGWPQTREHFGAAIPTLSEPQGMNYGAAASEPEDEHASRYHWQDAEADEESHADAAYSPNFGLQAQPAERQDEDGAADDEDADQQGAEWESQMDRPWREIVEASRMSAEEDDEDAETAIREALKAALEQPGELGASAEPYQQQVRGGEPAERPRSESGWDPFAPRDMQPHHGSGTAYDESDAETLAEAAEADHPPFTVPEHDPAVDREQDEDDEPPFKLTGFSARRAVYQASEADADESEDGEDAATRNAGFEHDIEDAFRAAPLPKRGIEPDKRRHNETLTDFDKIYDEQETGGQFGPEFYDDDAAALQAELESTDLAAYEAPRSGGGLAVAAAWAVFFSVMSGVALALVTLRSEVMAALPGTISLYRSVGFDVAESGIDFADVSYRWTEAQGKPMIEVKGQVVNVTDRRLSVPRVLINVRDAKSQDAVKVTASVPTESLAPRESASFTLEFVSPPKNISQIELEFDRNR